VLIGIKELLRDGEFPPEISHDIGTLIKIISIKQLAAVLKEYKERTAPE
jgi:hypothetical protein